MLDFYRMRFLINRLPTAEGNVAEAMSVATKTTTVLTGMPRGSGTGDQTGDGAVMLLLAQESLEKLRSELDAMRKELAPLIDQLEDDTYRKVIQLRYMDGLTVHQVALATTYSRSQTYVRLREAERAISELQNKTDNN